MKTASSVVVLAAVVAGTGPARGDLTLVARYDWRDGAADSSGFPVRHDGVLDAGASVEGGRLVVAGCDGVAIDSLWDLAGAREVVVRFEDVDFTLPGEGFAGRYSALAGGAGDGVEWWVAIQTLLPPYEPSTALKFNIGGWTYDHQEVGVIVADETVTHFDSIEYRFDGTAPPGERISFRWDGGPWIAAGWSDPDSCRAFPVAPSVRINDGCRADWDWYVGSLGTVSFYTGPGAGSGRQRPGDGDQDGSLGISDPIFLLEHLFLGEHRELPCGGDLDPSDEGNRLLFDSDGDGEVNISDAVYVLWHLFLGGPPPVLGTECVPLAGCPDSCR